MLGARALRALREVRPLRAGGARGLGSGVVGEGGRKGPSSAKLAEVDKRLREAKVETVVVGYTDLYGRLLGKRYDVVDFVKNAAKSGAHSCTYVFTVDMPMNPQPGFEYANWERGFGDFHVVPDLDSLTVCGWAPGVAVVLCDAANTETHELVSIAPRTILKRQLERAAKLLWEGRHVEVKAASELEHYLFEDDYRGAHAKGYANLTRAGWYSEDYHILQGHRTEPYHAAVRRGLRASGIHVENSKGETGVGQHEINVQYDEMLRMADRHVLFKQCMKEIASDMGKSVTFMAKPFADDAGSGCHIHTSMVDKATGKNVFQGAESLDSIQNCSALFKHFLAGWIKHTPELFCLMAPTVNSFKRHCAGSWAPTATAWGKDNRTAGFRIVGSGPSLRIECRLPGADVNPYLVFASALAAGLDGVENKLAPPPIFEGDAYKNDGNKKRNHAPLPRSLGEAAELFAKSKFVKDAFGADVQKHLAHFYHLEQLAYDRQVSDWERKRYFEQI
jgi:glutamine synthetase